VTHQSGNIIIRSLEAPVGGESSPVKVRDFACLIAGFILGALLL